MHDVILYTRQGCHLCDVVKETLQRLEHRAHFTWREIDVDRDEELRRKFNEEVPVVFINGRKVFKYSMTEDEFLKKLER
jgi:glutaredoxin